MRIRTKLRHVEECVERQRRLLKYVHSNRDRTQKSLLCFFVAEHFWGKVLDFIHESHSKFEIVSSVHIKIATTHLFEWNLRNLYEYGVESYRIIIISIHSFTQLHSQIFIYFLLLVDGQRVVYIFTILVQKGLRSKLFGWPVPCATSDNYIINGCTGAEFLINDYSECWGAATCHCEYTIGTAVVVLSVATEDDAVSRTNHADTTNAQVRDVMWLSLLPQIYAHWLT